MDISISTTNTFVSPVAREIIEDRLEASLDRFQADIVSVSVTFSDQNGPKGGRDHRCVLTLRGRRFRHMVAVADGQNAEHAATLAARKMAERIRKMLCQLADHRGHTPRQPPTLESEPAMEWHG